MYRAWANNRPNEDVIDVYLTGYTDDEGTPAQRYAIFDPEHGLVWHPFEPYEIIRPFLSLDGVASAIALQDADHVLIHHLIKMGGRLAEALNQPTFGP